MPDENAIKERKQQFAKVIDVLGKNRAQLAAIPGVMNARPGYRFRNGWITKEPVITVTVKEKKPLVALKQGEVIPSQVEGVGVDVRPASPLQRFRAAVPAEAVASVADLSAVREEELALPGWDLKPPADMIPQSVEMALKDGGYKPPDPNVVKLEEVEEEMAVTCCVSPEQGWANLKPFLEGVNRRLTIAMYDFTAPHIADTVQTALKPKPRELSLILDPKVALPSAKQRPTSNKGDDLTEDEIQERLEKALGQRFEFVWGAVSFRGKVTQGLFPNAYHIKVAVRDGEAFWLSSGNWQSSNQPDVQALGLSTRELQQKYNREWHVIVEHEGLAQSYEKFIQYDIEQAQPLQAQPTPEEVLMAPAAGVSFDEQLQVEFAPKEYETHDPKRFEFKDGKTLRVMPLLTPDNYADHVLEVIGNAKQKLFFQNQYIKIKQGAEEKFNQVVDALLGKMNEGLDVRIILRNEGDVGAMLEALQYAGFDMDKVKLQLGCHNKGVIVDSKVVVVGSHNWSSDGVVRNRDASLIFYDEGIAKYFEDVYVYDWKTLAHQRVLSEVVTPTLAAAAAAPEGGSTTVVMPWSDVYED